MDVFFGRKKPPEEDGLGIDKAIVFVQPNSSNNRWTRSCIFSALEEDDNKNWDDPVETLGEVNDFDALSSFLGTK